MSGEIDLVDFLDPKTDIVFKTLFGTDENKDLLISLLNEILEAKDHVASIDLLNTYLDVEVIEDKRSILDIKARDQNGKQINIEIQLANHNDMHKRSLFYWSKMYSEQMKVKETYVNLVKTISINIVNFDMFQIEEKFHNVFTVREKDENFPLTDDLEIHFIELKKIKRLADGGKIVDNKFNRWFLFLIDPLVWRDIYMKEPIIGRASEKLIKLGASEEFRAKYDARIKAKYEENSANQFHMTMGIETGLKITIKNLLSMKTTDMDFISKVIGRNMSETEKLVNEVKAEIDVK